ncbi:hypothetical protein P167DRAFT_580336 [Morchella conica CCBAS932]|uniref:F-box domain-containing protein n=1 Tax=Morchella conica CCBAS932 TaxID=1392247 RepID=A0A3N4K7R4_9PEZI|nr:hypothetical protein P167DRAFT_580336 [Morchella conica CCBAS932]
MPPPPELLLLITTHLPARPLCNLAATYRALHTRLLHQRTARFAIAAPDYVSSLKRKRHVPSSRAYKRILALLGYTAEKGCTQVVRWMACGGCWWTGMGAGGWGVAAGEGGEGWAGGNSEVVVRDGGGGAGVVELEGVVERFRRGVGEMERGMEE